MRFILVFGPAILVAGCSTNTGPSMPQGSSSQFKPQAPTWKEEDSIGVDVWAKFKENETQAATKYKFKRTEVTGTIVKVYKTQEFPPHWMIYLRRSAEPGDYHYALFVKGDLGTEMVKHAKIGLEMTVQGSPNFWDSSEMLLIIECDKLISVK